MLSELFLLLILRNTCALDSHHLVRRCVRPDETSTTVRCHYLTDGSVTFAFAIRRAEYFIPVGVLLKCFAEVSDRELFGYLTASAPQDAGAASVLLPDVCLCTG